MSNQKKHVLKVSMTMVDDKETIRKMAPLDFLIKFKAKYNLNGGNMSCASAIPKPPFRHVN